MKIKLNSFKILLLIFILFNSINLKSQELIWLKNTWGYHVYKKALAIDNENNIYTTGIYSTVANSFEDVTLDNNNNNIFLAKYIDNGDLDWVVNSISNNNITGRSKITLDSLNNAYILGDFYGTISFNESTLNSSGGKDVYIAKYSSNGELIWVNHISSNNNVSASNITVDPEGNAFVSGGYDGSLFFNNTFLQTDHAYDKSFLIKIGTTGDYEWIKTSIYASFSKLNANSQGDLYFSGKYPLMYSQDSVSYINWGLDTFTVCSTPTVKIYNGKYDSDGNLKYLKSFTSISNTLKNFKIDKEGNSFILFSNSGDIHQSDTLIEFDDFEHNTLVKFDRHGNFIWLSRLDSDTSLVLFATIEINHLNEIYTYGTESEIISEDNSNNYQSFGIKECKINNNTGLIERYSLYENVPFADNIRQNNNNQLIFFGSTVNLQFQDTTLNSGHQTGWLAVMSDITTKVNLKSRNKKSNIFPNPSSGFIFIECNNLIQTEVYNLSGKLIQKTNKNQIDLSTQKKGVYIVKLISKESVETTKVLVE